MKLKTLALLCATTLSCGPLWAGQDVYEARTDAMGGAGVAAGDRMVAGFINPALLSLTERQSDDVSLLLPTLGADGADKDKMVDKFDDVQDNYDALELAIDNRDVEGMIHYRDQLLGNLQSLVGNSAYASAGLGLAVVLPSSKRLSVAIIAKSYLDGFALADISESDLSLLSTLDPLNPPSLDDLSSQGRVIAGAVSDVGVALSSGFTVADMPLTVGITPKLQRLDTFNYAVSANNFDVNDFDSDDYRNDDTGFNLDVGVALQPMPGLTLGLSGRNLVKQDLQTMVSEGRQLTYQIKPMVTAGVAYEWRAVTLTSDIDLTENNKFAELEGPKYWRVGGEVKATDWLAVRLGYRQDLNDVTTDIYSVGTGIAIGKFFRLDLTGMFGSDNAIGGALQTSYHF
ncbi:conjugal transfer protein TraF [Shewanella dokdonensis]|uniref:Conjugal transfer protein TraF n=1 Tax=Shewanella dokdonensis TaxID=712036 RepID=A0ABX8DB59_9GAMM|nr:conjugal transfer protein TraF [Shewanella dokdonensis]MCL1075382.1 conjugal transfer protein TraF [Shewanella dokdonensis]QVK22082.1 conjugal transfer protein TraF [Shewanella dokdonensis]